MGPTMCMWFRVVAWWLEGVGFLQPLGVGGRLNKTQLPNAFVVMISDRALIARPHLLVRAISER